MRGANPATELLAAKAAGPGAGSPAEMMADALDAACGHSGIKTTTDPSQLLADALDAAYGASVAGTPRDLLAEAMEAAGA